MEITFFWGALGCYVLSSLAYMTVFAFGRERCRQWGIGLAGAGLLLHTVSLALRWIETGHGPYISTYEVFSSDVWITVAFFLFFQWRSRKFAGLGVLVMPLSFLMMGFALLGSREVRLLPPSLRSAWLVVHIVFAKLTVASLLVAVALAIAYLVKEDKEPAKEGVLARLPGPGILDDYIYRMTAFGFVALTIMIVTGIIWGNYAWGSYWSWDPAQTWSLVVWIVYGLYMHGRITFRWRGRVSSWYIIFAFLFSIAAFFVMPYFVKDLHSQYMAR